MPGQWELVERGNSQITYTNPNAQYNQVGFPAGPSSGTKVKFTVDGTKSHIRYEGPDGSPHTTMALQIAAMIARK